MMFRAGSEEADQKGPVSSRQRLVHRPKPFMYSGFTARS
jgi:hypothetical protein